MHGRLNVFTARMRTLNNFKIDSLRIKNYRLKGIYTHVMRISTSTTGTDICAYIKSVALTAANTKSVEARLKLETVGSVNGQTVYMYDSAGKLAQIFVLATGIKCNAFGTTPTTITTDTTLAQHTFQLKFNGTTNVEYYVDGVLKHTTPYAELYTSVSNANTLGFGDPNNSANTGGSVLWKYAKYNPDVVGSPAGYTEWTPVSLPSAQGWTSTGTESLATIIEE